MRTLLFFAALAPHHAYSVDKKIMRPINKYCEGIKKEVVLGIIRIESNFKNTGKNPSNGIGYMQVKLRTARWIKCGARKNRDLRVPSINVKCGCQYLRLTLDKFSGNYAKAIAAYNAGSAINCKTGRLRNGKRCKIGKLINQQYVNTVLAYAEGYKWET
jgi:soluble lytic murein transglycosylase-like protein